MPTSTMSSRGQTVIPKAIREHLGLHPGDLIDFVVGDDGGVLVRPAVEDVRRLKGILQRPRRGAVPVQAMNQAIRRRARRLV
ncbi:MAG: AbrB/MazE/SpoVT family DNA-binding domain-containing protein [Bryobacterales bacterium]|nr:AbrB/MazE/SpoVT family DNA-binding domain-containing protein [Bryobacterales bacterium]